MGVIINGAEPTMTKEQPSLGLQRYVGYAGLGSTWVVVTHPSWIEISDCRGQSREDVRRLGHNSNLELDSKQVHVSFQVKRLM